MSWLGRVWNRLSRGQGAGYTAIYWGENLWLVEPPPLREGLVSGKLRRAKARTWAGAEINVDDHLNYTELFVLELGSGVYAPLKPAPGDPETLGELRGTVAAWQPGGEGPVEESEHVWLDEAEVARRGWSLDSPLETHALCYPMFSAGTIVPFRIWGFYVIDTPR
jgi:hypothetical protein